MNKENLVQLADYIASNYDNFSMLNCTDCIMGHANQLWDRTLSSTLGGCWPSKRRVAQKLGLTQEQTEKLFYPEDIMWGRVGVSPYDRSTAVKVIREFAETGEVNWPTAAKETT